MRKWSIEPFLILKKMQFQITNESVMISLYKLFTGVFTLDNLDPYQFLLIKIVFISVCTYSINNYDSNQPQIFIH